jgi:hypothetical protein
MKHEEIEFMNEAINLLQDFFKNDVKVDKWLNSPNLNFGGATAINLFLNGKGHKVLLFVKNALDENNREQTKE